MSEEKPALAIYDSNGLYHDLLPLAEQQGIKVIDTTKAFLHARLDASRYWCDKLGKDPNARMIIYRKAKMPSSSREWVAEPFVAFIKSAALFPFGPADEYKNICRQFLPTKENELNNLFTSGTTSFNMVNALLEGQAFPALEALTGGRSVMEITKGLLKVDACSDMNWLSEWKTFANAHYPGLDPDGSTLKEVKSKLWSYLLFSEFVLDLPEELPDSLSSVPHATEAMKENIYSICDNIRNEHNMRDAYVTAANRISTQLNLPDLFRSANHLGLRVTFNFENFVEYTRFIQFIKDNNIDEATSMLDKNVRDVWYQEDEHVESFWKLATQLVNLCKCINSGVQADGSLNDLVQWYATSGYKADLAFRKFHTEKLNGTAPLEDDLTKLLNDRYRDFTERSVKVYQSKAKDISSFPALANQVCPQLVYDALHNNRRVALVFVDAFRYEMGISFFESMRRSYQDRATCSPRISVLPSVTRFGMAHHLDTISMKSVDGKLQPFIGDNIVSSVDDRINYLKEKTTVEVQDMSIDTFDDTAVNSSTRLLVIRSQAIDKSGEDGKLAGVVAMEAEVKNLVRRTEQCRRLGFDEIYFVADHGFMLQPAFRVSDKIDKPAGSNIVLEESRCLVGNLNESADTVSFTPQDLGIDGDFMKIAYAKNFTVFRRGDIYYHEGLSLQENIVPVICIKLKEERPRDTFSVSLKYKGESSGTVRTLAPLIDISIISTNLFADVNMKLTITDALSRVIGEPASSAFYDDCTELLTVPAGTTSFRQKVIIEDDYEGSEIVVTAMDADTNATLAKLRLNFETLC